MPYLLRPLALGVALLACTPQLAGAQDRGASRAQQASQLVDRLARQKDMGTAERMQVYSQLVGLGPHARRVLAKRWRELDESPGQWAIAMIARTEPALGLVVIRDAQTSDNVPIRRAAASAMVDLLKTEPEPLIELANLFLQDADQEICIDAVSVLSSIGTPETWRPLLDLVVRELSNDPSTSLRQTRELLIRAALEELATLLERHGDHMMVRDLFDRAAQLKLQGKDDEVDYPYERLFQIIGQRPSKIVLPYLRRILEESYRAEVDASARHGAVEDEEEEQIVVTFPDPTLTIALDDIFGEDGQGGIAEDLRPWHREIRMVALGTTAQLRDPESLPFILRGMRDPDDAVRSRALEVVGWVMPTDPVARLDCFEAVVPLLVDPQKRVRRQATRWLQGYARDKGVPQSYSAWLAWIGEARRHAKVEKHVLELARQEGYETIDALLKAHIVGSVDEYLLSLGYDDEDEFLQDMEGEYDE